MANDKTEFPAQPFIFPGPGPSTPSAMSANEFPMLPPVSMIERTAFHRPFPFLVLQVTLFPPVSVIEDAARRRTFPFSVPQVTMLPPVSVIEDAALRRQPTTQGSTVVIPALHILANAACVKKKPFSIKFTQCPGSEELVSRTCQLFSIFCTGDKGIENLFIAATLMNTKTMKAVIGGLVDKPSPKKRTNVIAETEKGTFLYRYMSYNEICFRVGVLKGSAKQEIHNFVRFQIRLYETSSPVGRYEILDNLPSPSYRILTHSKQCGRSSKV